MALLPLNLEEVFEEVQAALHTQEPLTERPKFGDLLQAVGVEVMELHLKMKEKAAKEITPRHTHQRSWKGVNKMM